MTERKIKPRDIEVVVSMEVATRLFSGGDGSVADRLVQVDAANNPGGGWVQISVRRVVAEVLMKYRRQLKRGHK